MSATDRAVARVARTLASRWTRRSAMGRVGARAVAAARRRKQPSAEWAESSDGIEPGVGTA